MKAYKGFNKDMTCRGFQYEEGKTYETDRVEFCEAGFHACLNPLDIYYYYRPGGSEYHEVEIEDIGQRCSYDTKVVGRKIKIGAKLSNAEICKAHFEYIKSQCDPVDGKVAGDGESLSVGDKASVSVGDCGSASAGWRASAYAGDYGSASAGCRGSAFAGDHGASASAGCRGSAFAGDHGSASAGNYGSAYAGDYGSASAGDCGSASARWGGSASAGDYGSASAGAHGSAYAGWRGSAVSRGMSSVGKDGVACVKGVVGVKAKGGIGAVIVIAIEDDNNHEIKEWKAGLIDGENLKPDTWYTIKNGKFVEVKE